MKSITLLLMMLICLPAIAIAEGRPMNELPMYGGKHNPTVPQNKKYSESAAALGWKYYYKGDLDTAMKRFNQAWMFDRNSVNALWGFGVIMGRRAEQEQPEENLKESIRFLRLAADKDSKNARILVDLAFSHTLLGQYLKEKNKAKSKDKFLTAAQLFEDAAKLDSRYPLLHFNWSLLEFYMGNYLKARERLEQAKMFGFQADPSYVKALDEKLKE